MTVKLFVSVHLLKVILWDNNMKVDFLFTVLDNKLFIIYFYTAHIYFMYIKNIYKKSKVKVDFKIMDNNNIK